MTEDDGAKFRQGRGGMDLLWATKGSDRFDRFWPVNSGVKNRPLATDAEIMYQITEKFWDEKMRQEALKVTIERAFETKQCDVVVKAAKDLNPTSQNLI